MLAAFASSDKDDVALAGIDIIVLENEELVDAILLKGSDFYDSTNRPHETAIKHNVLLATNL